MAQVGNLIALPTFGEHGAVNVVVESPRGATLKLTFDPDLGVMTLSRPLPQGLVYPHDWGFIPSTRAEDGDPLDAIVVWDGVGYPGVVIACRPIGVLQIEQNNKETGERERNDRLAVLPVDAPRWNSIRTIDDLGERACLELEHFFREAVAFEGKELRAFGWKGPAAAMKLVRASIRTTRGKRR